MLNQKRCTQNCPKCKFALVVESDKKSMLLSPDNFVVGNEEAERLAMLQIFQWQTPIIILCYLPEDISCSYLVRTDKNLLSKTHPEVFIDQMVDLYENIPLDFLEKQITERQLLDVHPSHDRHPYWLPIYKKIYERKTGHAYIEN